MTLLAPPSFPLRSGVPSLLTMTTFAALRSGLKDSGKCQTFVVRGFHREKSYSSSPRQIVSFTTSCPDEKFKGATLSLPTWSLDLGAFKPQRIWIKFFQIPLHAWILYAWQPVSPPFPLYFRLGEPCTSETLDPKQWIRVSHRRKPLLHRNHPSPNPTAQRVTQNPIQVNHPHSTSLLHPAIPIPKSHSH
ncbi:hypothetical protein AMTR_s00088p00164540 [Amborella trichopoda]|uniref:Uncharacterized protein n=1 Tax=Amborella trichopoda TaxID=13333 RepID=W1NRK6_AMBTC|nr:hypothetical protein AMTR_s00088p00164540 [Amborella trichopoda]